MGVKWPLRGGDMVVVDRVWTQVRKVRRRRITEAVLDPLGSPYDSEWTKEKAALQQPWNGRKQPRQDRMGNDLHPHSRPH